MMVRATRCQGSVRRQAVPGSVTSRPTASPAVSIHIFTNHTSRAERRVVGRFRRTDLCDSVSSREVGVVLRHGGGEANDAGAEDCRDGHRLVKPEMVDEEADQGRPCEEGGVTEGDDDEYSAAADVAGDRVYLRRDHADSQSDQSPADEQQWQAADEGHDAVADRGAVTAEPDDCTAAEASDETVAEQADDDHAAAHRDEAEGAGGGVDLRDLGDV